MEANNRSNCWKGMFNQHRSFLEERMDPDSGLLDKLLDNKTISKREYDSIKDNHPFYRRNDRLLDCIGQNEKYDSLIGALRDTRQTHLVNYLIGNGEHNSGYDGDWPLTCTEISVLDTNRESFVDLVDCSDLLRRLYSKQVINGRQRVTISSEPTNHGRNEILLDILRRRSIDDYRQVVGCLRESNQSHVAEILENRGVAVRVHADLGNDKEADQTEDDIITRIRDILNGKSLDEASPLLIKINQIGFKLRNLPLEILDIILQKSYLHWIFNASTKKRDDVVIRYLLSVDVCFNRRITRQRFKKAMWRYLKDLYAKTKRRHAVIRNNRNYLLESIQPNVELIASLLALNCITTDQSHFIQRQHSKRNKNAELIKIMRSFDEAIFLNFVTCLRQTNQTTVARFIDNGGAVVKVQVKMQHSGAKCTALMETQELLHQIISDILCRTKPISTPTGKFIYQMREEDIEILNSQQKRQTVVVWIWCRSQAALEHIQKLYESNQLRRLFFEIIQPSISTVIKIDRNQFKKIVETSTQFDNCAVVVGFGDGKDTTKDVVKINLHRSNEISKLDKIPVSMDVDLFAAVYRNTLYLTGVGFFRNQIWNYNQTYGWKKCASTDVRSHRRYSAAFIREVLYICGGFLDYSDAVLDSVEAFNAVSNKCKIVGNLVHSVHNSGNCVPFKDLLYIFGGLDKDDNPFNHVQVYNTKENTCSVLSSGMPRPCSLLRSVLWETSVILVGSDHCFIFNIETETWQKREQFKADAYYFGLVLENDRIFLIGGGRWDIDKDGKAEMKCRDDVRYVLLQKILQNKPIEWKIHGKLPKPCLVHCCASMRFIV